MHTVYFLLCNLYKRTHKKRKVTWNIKSASSLSCRRLIIMTNCQTDDYLTYNWFPPYLVTIIFFNYCAPCVLPLTLFLFDQLFFLLKENVPFSALFILSILSTYSHRPPSLSFQVIQLSTFISASINLNFYLSVRDTNKLKHWLMCSNTIKCVVPAPQMHL